MPAKFHSVAPAVWNRQFRQASGPAKVVAFYVWTCRERITEGLFELPFGHVIHDTNLSEKQVRDAFTELDEIGFVTYDEDAEVVLDRRALRDNPLRHGRDKTTGEVKRNGRMTSAIRLVEQVPETPLKRGLHRLALEHSPDFAVELAAVATTNIDHLRETPPSSPPPPQGPPPREEQEQEREPDRRGSAGLVVGSTCNQNGCQEPARWTELADLGRLGWCDQHRGQAEFGEVVPIDDGKAA
jgi:hypothetical protein